MKVAEEEESESESEDDDVEVDLFFLTTVLFFPISNLLHWNYFNIYIYIIALQHLIFRILLLQIEYDDRAKQESLKQQQQQPLAVPKPAANTTAAVNDDSDEDDFDIDAI